MPNWDANSPELRENLARVSASIRKDAERRPTPTLLIARTWHDLIMSGLTLPDDVPSSGVFRGEAGLEDYEVGIGSALGVWASNVSSELQAFETMLQTMIAALDQRYPEGTRLDATGLADVLDVAAWAHSEWVRIHPFPNGNGRTARAWVNWIFVRYGVPPIVPLRPRPSHGYSAACVHAMNGNWEPMSEVFRTMLKEATAAPAPGGSSTRQPRTTDR